MLIIRIELWPFGVKENAREIASLKITNNGSHSDRPDFGNYDAILEDGTRYENIVENHLRAEGSWRLVMKALHHLVNRKQVL